MKISILTLFPEMFDIFNHSIIGRAREKNIIDLECYNGVSYERLRYVSIIGMYYERILKKYIVVI